MAYSPGFSIVAADKGAQAMTDILAQPSILKAEQAKSQLEQLKAAGQKAYMDAAKNPLSSASPSTPTSLNSSVDPAAETGIQAYQNTIQAQQVMQQRQAIKQEEARIKLLAPEDQSAARGQVELMQRDLAMSQKELSDKHQEYLGKEYALYDSVHDQNTLDSARSYAKRGIEAMADQAIKDGKIHPENKDAFVNDQLNQMFPKTYDKANIEARKKGLMTIQEQIKNKQADAQNKRAQAEIALREAEGKRLLMATDRTIASSNLKMLSEERNNLTQAISGNNRSIENMVTQLNGLQKQKSVLSPTVPNPDSLFGSIPNPDLDAVNTEIATLSSGIKSLRDQNIKLTSQRDVLLSKESRSTAPKDTTTTKKTITAQEFSDKWSKLKAGETLVGPDGKTYTKK